MAIAKSKVPIEAHIIAILFLRLHRIPTDRHPPAVVESLLIAWLVDQLPLVAKLPHPALYGTKATPVEAYHDPHPVPHGRVPESLGG